MNNFKRFIGLPIFFAIALTCISCSDELSMSNDESRNLDVTNSNVSVFDVASYYSLNRYGPTKKIYDFKDQNAVVIISISNSSIEFTPVVTVYIFDAFISNDSIDKWINNQHSDAIFGDAPKPIGTYILAAGLVSLTSSNFIDHTVEFNGDEYDNYQLEILISDSSETNVYSLTSLIAKTKVHVQTAAPTSNN